MRAVVNTGRLAIGLLIRGVVAALPLAAGANNTASAEFLVAVRLAPAAHSGICVSEPLSEQTHAVFEVTCSSGHFVSLSPQPGRPFVGTHGGAFRFLALPRSRGALPSPFLAPNLVADALPEVAMLRVSSSRSTFDGQVEVLVSF
jgi:hypothetical protein